MPLISWVLVMGLLLPPSSGSTPTTPFGVGEKLDYQARFTMLRPGSASLQVEGIETVRGVPSWRFRFETELSLMGLFEHRSVMTSWTGTADMISRRFLKTVDEDGKHREDDFRIFPDSGFSRRGADTATAKAPTQALDDVAFFYFIRTIPLEVGKTYSFARYWRDDKNPVTIKVLKREEMKMPDGAKVSCLVLHPIVDEPHGMFSKRSSARLWLTDDARRLPVQIQSTYPFGTVKLVLTGVTLGAAG